MERVNEREKFLSEVDTKWVSKVFMRIYRHRATVTHKLLLALLVIISISHDWFYSFACNKRKIVARSPLLYPFFPFCFLQCAVSDFQPLTSHGSRIGSKMKSSKSLLLFNLWLLSLLWIAVFTLCTIAVFSLSLTDSRQSATKFKSFLCIILVAVISFICKGLLYSFEERKQNNHD